MPRNTFIVISVLAVIAALVVGVNVGKGMNTGQTTLPTPAVTPEEISPTPISPSLTTYTNTNCGISFDYPANFMKQEVASSASTSAGAVFADPQNTGSTSGVIVFTCQKDIPRPPLLATSIETILIGSTSAKLYHDTNAKDGSPTDKLIVRHPKTGLDIFLAGLGTTFRQVVASIKILP